MCRPNMDELPSIYDIDERLDRMVDVDEIVGDFPPTHRQRLTSMCTIYMVLVSRFPRPTQNEVSDSVEQANAYEYQCLERSNDLLEYNHHIQLATAYLAAKVRRTTMLGRRDILQKIRDMVEGDLAHTRKPGDLQTYAPIYNLLDDPNFTLPFELPEYDDDDQLDDDEM